MNKKIFYELDHREVEILEKVSLESLPQALRLFRELDNFEYIEGYDELSIGGTKVDYLKINNTSYDQIREFPEEFIELVEDEDTVFEVAVLLDFLFRNYKRE